MTISKTVKLTICSVIAFCSIQSASALVNTDSFILNAGHDLGSVVPQGTYYTPIVKYTDAAGVQKRMADGLSYPGDFYASRHISYSVVDGTDPYISIDWNRPAYVTSLNSVRQKLAGFLFSYRENGKFRWIDGSALNSHFLTGYENKANQSVILYPITEKKTKKTLGFMEYPCGNLVCRDERCSDLDVAPVCGDGVTNQNEECDYKDPKTSKGCTQQCTYNRGTCTVSPRSATIFHTEKPALTTTKDSYVRMDSYTVAGKTYKPSEIYNLPYLAPGTYTVSGTGTNTDTNRTVQCKSNTLTVQRKELKCYVSSYKTDWLDTDSIYLTKRTDYGLTFSKFVIAGKTYDKNTSYVKLAPGKYTIEGYATDDKFGATVKCDGGDINVTKKLFCGDGVVSGSEECDLGTDGNVAGSGCTSYCKYEIPYCSLGIKSAKVKYDDTIDDKIYYTVRNGVESFAINGKALGGIADIKGKPANAFCEICNNNVVLTVKNKINPSLVKTCQVSFYMEHDEVCGDGIKNNGEQCDYKDPKESLFCSKSCTYKVPDRCEILLGQDDYAPNSNLQFAIVSEPWAKVTASTGTTAIYGYSGLFTFYPRTEGTYVIKAVIANPKDATKVRECSASVKVSNSAICPTAATTITKDGTTPSTNSTPASSTSNTNSSTSAADDNILSNLLK